MFWEIVVLDFDAEDNDATCCGYQIRREKEDAFATQHQALNHEADSADAHHEEGGKGNTVSLTCTYSLNSLRKIAQNHADAGYPTADVEY